MIFYKEQYWFYINICGSILISDRFGHYQFVSQIQYEFLNRLLMTIEDQYFYRLTAIVITISISMVKGISIATY